MVSGKYYKPRKPINCKICGEMFERTHSAQKICQRHTKSKNIAFRLNGEQLATLQEKIGDRELSMGEFARECILQVTPSEAEFVGLKKEVENLKKRLHKHNQELILFVKKEIEEREKILSELDDLLDI